MSVRAAIEIELTGFGNELGIWQGKGRFQKRLRFQDVCIPGKMIVTRIENERQCKRVDEVQFGINLIQLDI